MPNLLEIQILMNFSYRRREAEDREDIGLQAVFNKSFSNN